MKKHLLILLIALLSTMPLLAQYSPCYEAAFAEGQKQFKAGNYTKAMKYFNEAKDCPDSNTTKVNEWIGKCIAKINEKEDLLYKKCNTIASCEEYLKQYPNGRFKSKVQSLKKRLEDEATIPEGALKGLFSVSPYKRVYFSKGNLRYLPKTNEWSFHEQQWNSIGKYNLLRQPNYEDWIDLFAWGTSNYRHGAECYQPWSNSSEDDYNKYYPYNSESANLFDKGGKADWGYNAISNGGNQENIWRTLTEEEWEYLLNKRKTSSGIRFVKANVNGINGLLILPDDWDSSICSLHNANHPVSYKDNIIKAETWETLFQSHGAAFLPAAGNRYSSSESSHFINGYGIYGRYWSSTRYISGSSADAMWFTDKEYICSDAWTRLSDWCAVRLVCDVAKTDQIIRKDKGNTNANSNKREHEYVDLGLPSGTLWATCNVGADSPEDYGEYFAWGEVQPQKDGVYNWSSYRYSYGEKLTKYCSNSYHGKDGFTDNLKILEFTDDVATANWGAAWRTPTKEEWQELLDNTSNKWITQNNVKGWLFTAMNGNSIFLPAAGDRWNNMIEVVGKEGYYWSSNLDSFSVKCAWSFRFYEGNNSLYSNYTRVNGFSVRPIRKK